MTSLLFYAVLFFSVIIYWLIPRQSLRNLFLSLCSIGYLTTLDHWSPVIILSLSVFSYVVAKQIENSPRSALWHKFGVIGLLVVLVVFKYLGMLNNIMLSLHQFIQFLPSFQFEKLLLPLGISYITFKHISYLTDVHWKLTKAGNFIDFVEYSSLFTIYVAGPIERFERFQPQVAGEKLRFNFLYVDEGFTRIVYGLAKKLILADWIGHFTSPIWNNPDHHSLIIRIGALVGYSLQIYFDFSGYSDIAIGTSRLFGIKIMENFNNPYLQKNISQFWRCWHISLSDWIRDYLFFPLNQVMQNKFWAICCVPIIAMGLCGLWHGAEWHFVIWGMWHGAGIAVYQLWNQYKRKNKQLAKALKANVYGYIATLITYSFVTIGWWWFR